MLAQVLRFVGIGGLATLAHVLTAMAVQAAFPVTAQAANLAGFVAGFTTSYAGHARVTFNAPLRSAPQFLRFLALSLLGLAASSLTVWLVTTVIGASFAMAMAAVVVIVPAISFAAMRLWVFSQHARMPRAPAWEPGLSAALALTLLVVFWNRLVNHDIAWYLFATREWLAGARLYVDLVEVNPPLNFYLTAIALGLADLLGIDDQNGHYLAVALLLFVSLWWSGVVLRQHFDLSAGRRAALVCGSALATTLPTLDGMGQREQIMVLFFLPWAFYQAAGRENLPSATFAAIGMCLKPHFVLLPLAVTVLNCLQARSLRPVLSPSNLVFLGVGLAYLAYVRAIHPAYLFDILPVAMEVYGGFGSSPFAKVVWIIGYPLGMFALIAVFVLRSPQPMRGPAVFLALALGGLGSYFLQGTGWSYHKVPFLAFSMVMGCLLLATRPRPGVEVLPVVIGLLGFVTTGVHQGFYDNRIVSVVERALRDEQPVRALITLTDNMFTGPAVAMALGADWASSYPTNWLVPGAIKRLAITDCLSQAETCNNLQAIAARNRTANIRDIGRFQPDLIIVDTTATFGMPGFDWLTFMAADPAWGGILSGYRQLPATGGLLYFIRTGEKTPP